MSKIRHELCRVVPTGTLVEKGEPRTARRVNNIAALVRKELGVIALTEWRSTVRGKWTCTCGIRRTIQTHAARAATIPSTALRTRIANTVRTRPRARRIGCAPVAVAVTANPVDACCTRRAIIPDAPNTSVKSSSHRSALVTAAERGGKRASRILAARWANAK